MNKTKKARVLMAKHILECHDRGVKTMIRMLRDSGVEVIYTIYRTPEDIIAAALEEDVDVIGLSFFSGAYFENIPTLMNLMEKNGLQDIIVVVGGLIPDVDEPELLKLGIKSVFGPGSDISKFIDLVKDHARARAN
ncbi:cobalamin B12-binding domain-containing protein [Candidatus Bathyarchaeota archaeon]|nr:cobalamin B12-binding domain-containing protein [Candidatus Bathyarchaeota archaeon]